MHDGFAYLIADRIDRIEGRCRFLENHRHIGTAQLG
jgi:hypothetical protein